MFISLLFFKVANLRPSAEESKLREFLTKSPMTEDEARAVAFAEILSQRVGSADQALIEMIKHQSLPDEMVRQRPISAHNASETFVILNTFCQ